MGAFTVLAGALPALARLADPRYAAPMTNELFLPDPASMTYDALIAECLETEKGAGDPRIDALAGEIERRSFDL